MGVEPLRRGQQRSRTCEPSSQKIWTFWGFYRKYSVKSAREKMLIWKEYDLDVQISLYTNGKVL